MCSSGVGRRSDTRRIFRLPPDSGTTQIVTYGTLGIFTPPQSFWLEGAPPGHSKDAKNLQKLPDTPAKDAAGASVLPPQPFRKEKRMKGLVKKSHVLSQVGKVSRVSAARSKVSAAVRGKEARSARNMLRYAERQQQTIDVVGDRLQCPVCDRRFKIAQYTRTHYIEG